MGEAYDQLSRCRKAKAELHGQEQEAGAGGRRQWAGADHWSFIIGHLSVLISKTQQLMVFNVDGFKNKN
jgi:hypothetical protein